jgi:hypothetical protein
MLGLVIYLGNRRLLVLSIATILFAGLIAGSGAVSNASALEEKVDFTVTVHELGISGGFAANIEHPSEMQADKGNLAGISYSLSAASGSLTITIPLSYFSTWLYPIDDVPITIPLPETPIGELPISVLKYIPGGAVIPSGLADVSIVLQGAIAAKTVSCSSGQTDVVTGLSSLKWTSWGSKTMQIQTHEENPSVTVITTFAYTLGVGITATVLGMKISLLNTVELSAVSGMPISSTIIQAVDPFPTALILGVVLIAVAFGGGYFFYRRWKRIPAAPQTIAAAAVPPHIMMPPKPPAIVEAPYHGAGKIPMPAAIQQHFFCPLDGAPLRGDSFCPRCGRKFT